MRRTTLALAGAALCAATIAILVFNPLVVDWTDSTVDLLAPGASLRDAALFGAVALVLLAVAVALVRGRVGRGLMLLAVGAVAAVPVCGLAFGVHDDFALTGCNRTRFSCQSLVGTASANWVWYYATLAGATLLGCTAAVAGRRRTLDEA